MAARAIWKGYLEIGELVCPVALHAAASTAERVSFHVLNRATGHRVRNRTSATRTIAPETIGTRRPGGGSSLSDSTARAAPSSTAATPRASSSSHCLTVRPRHMP